MKNKTKEADPYRTNADKVKAKMKATEGDKRWWKPRPGKHIIRVLPPWGPSADGSFFYTAGLHYGFQIGGQRRAIPCLKTREPGERCLVCEFIEALRASGSEDLEKLVSGNKGIRAKRKYWVNLIDRKYPEEVKMWGASRKFADLIKDEIEGGDFGDVTDPEEGHDIRVRRVGSGFTDTRYSFTIRPKPTPIDLEDWKSKVHKLDKVVIEWMSLAETAKILRANYSEEMAEVGFKIVVKGVKEQEEEEDEDEDETPKKAKKVAKKKSKYDDDDDEEEDKEGDNDSDEEDKDEDEDEDKDADDEEED